jgi:hypothetical protein
MANNEDISVLNAWATAEKACFDYLAFRSGLQAGKNFFIGDAPEETTKLNICSFEISGGQVQDQNFQCPRPNKRFIADCQLVGIYKERDAAMDIAGRIMQSLPAYYNEDDGVEESMIGRGLVPNVQAFEMLNFPEIFSVTETGDDPKNKGNRYYFINMNFRCVFNYEEN